MNMPSEQAKIFAVDDQPINLRVLDSILAETYTLSVTTNSLLAVEMARNHRPDLILLDVMMPKMDGYEVCRQLKNEPDTADIPVIFITSKSGEEDEVRGFACGAVDYISKPFKSAVVLARVKTHLMVRSMQQALLRQNAALLEADKMKADIERVTRHDLKSPIAGMVGFADFLLVSPTFSLAPEARQFVQFIHDAGRHALRMISLSLDLYKMEQGTYVLEAKRVDILPLIRSLAMELPSRSNTPRITLHAHGQPLAEGEQFWVFGDEILCYSLLSNLIKNASEASPANHPVTLSLENRDGMATIAIHNMGAVPAAIRDRFFEKYVTYGKKNGTGLGTYSARLITEVQQGRIRMETSEELGTTITVQLPARPEP